MSTTNIDPTIFCVAGMAVLFVVYLVSTGKQPPRKPYHRRGTHNDGKHRSIYEHSDSSSSTPKRVKANAPVTVDNNSQVKSWDPASTLTEALDRIDKFTGIEFEHYVAYLLRIQGYEAEVTPPSSDKGVDVVARKGGKKFAVQVKRYDGKVPQDAVMQVIAGQTYYACDAAMVVTNSFFNQNAIEYADRTGCMLVNRSTLADWIRLHDVAHELLTPATIVVDYVGDHYLAAADPSVTTITVSEKGVMYLMDKLREHVAQGYKIAIVAPVSVDAYEIMALNRLLVRALPQRKIVDLVGRELDWDTDAISWAQLEQNATTADILVRRDLPKLLLERVPELKVVVVSRPDDFKEEELLKLRSVLAGQKGKKWFYLFASQEPAREVLVG